MGVLNVTPDSFSDGGLHLDPEQAVARGLEMIGEGADIVDVGGESTRPGAEPVPEADEVARVVHVVAALSPHVRVSIDTTKRAVAEAAVEAGATIINDVSASLWPAAAEAGVGWIATHWYGSGATEVGELGDVVADVRAMLVERAAIAREAGVNEVWIDPGIGFGKSLEQNMALVARIDELVATGLPVAVGVSRKGTLGSLLAASDALVAEPALPGMTAPSPLDIASFDEQVPLDDRIEASLTMATYVLMQGAALVRVHDVRATAHAVKLVSGAVAA
jgi:dihydropteroate synthase